MLVPSASSTSLCPFADEQQTIDIDKNGNISKDELKVLIEEGDVANLSENDFTALFSAIDIDNNGTVDFPEFCAFFVSLPTQNEENFGDNSGAEA